MTIPRLDDVTRAESVQRSFALLLSALCRRNASTDGHARELMKTLGVSNGDLAQMEKAAIAAMTTGSGLAEMRMFWAALLALLVSAFDKIAFRPGLLNTRLAIESADSPTATIVAEGHPVPAAALNFDTIILRLLKLGVIYAISDELARIRDASRIPAAVANMQKGLLNAIAIGTDTTAFDPTNTASLTFGAPTITASGSVADDIADLLAGVTGGTPTRPYVVTGSGAARRLAFSGDAIFQNVSLAPGIAGNIGGIPQLTSPSPALADLVIALDADLIVRADAGIELDAVDKTSLQLHASPTNSTADGSSPPAPIATTMTSLWQTNAVALKAIRHVAWAKRDDAVAVLELTGSPA
jgi:hypothetical protein